ncbi:MAG: S8 family serine peptidase, partial [Clostridia bacterium]|nr:S8 family serine peptidase [Clostridia bacterium]
MKGKASKILALLLACCMVLGITACNDKATVSLENAGDGVFVEESLNNAPAKAQKDGAAVLLNNKTDSKDGKQNALNLGNTKADKNEQVSAGNVLDMTPKGEYNKGVVLVKFKDEFYPSAFGTLEYTSAKELYEGSKWYSVKLADVNKTEQAVEYLCELGNFEKVDYDYVMGVTADMSSVDVSSNPNSSKQPNLNLHGVKNGWYHNGKMPGGSPDVVVAVIDTGVDYNHLDLRNNIWVNTAEIADNGKDDDGNGYIDDIYGWDCVGDDKDPIDDNGHGTHVAGIIAAENNKIGGVGVAFDCKVMVLKAGNSSGYFNNSDIAEAIQYAYMNGASIINMSFGGSNISVAVEEALENAYNSCVLVAAAGNDGACNNLGCKACEKTGVSYPAALPFVIGVMSTNADGSAVSSFSNYDHCPYNAVEYEVYAVGEGAPSCWPNNKYASLNGTSMAAPTVSGIAALLRSYYTDREVYSTKYIQSQIVNTGTINPYNYILEEIDGAHTVANVYEAMTNIPKPEVNLYDYSVDDSVAINAANNGNGVIDAGETVRLYLSLHNRGGVATDVKVSVDTNRSEGLVDPYFTFVNDTISLSDIGTYSVRESGDKYFEIIVSPDCPNDYLIDFNIRYTYKNGLDENDNTVYEDDGKQKAQFNVSRGYHVPSIITEDTTYKPDRLYIIGEDVVIPEGVTVTFEAGCEIQFYDDREYYNSPAIIVYGELNINGTKDNMVYMHSSERYFNYGYYIAGYGVVGINYVNAENMFTGSATKNATTTVANSRCIANVSKSTAGSDNFHVIKDGYNKNDSFAGADRLGLSHHYCQYPTVYRSCYIDYPLKNSYFYANTIEDSIIIQLSESNCDLYAYNLRNNLIVIRPFGKKGSSKEIVVYQECKDNIFSTLDGSLNTLVPLYFKDKAFVTNNTFSKAYQQYASQLINNYYDSTGNPTVDVYGSCSDITKLWPYVVSVEMFDKDGNAITTVGREEIKVRVTFNRPMDTTKDTFLTFGTIEPYADYRINGEYISDT